MFIWSWRSHALQGLVFLRDHGTPQGIEIDYGIGGNFASLKGAPPTIGYPKMTMNCRRHHIPSILICKKKEGQHQINDGTRI